MWYNKVVTVGKCEYYDYAPTFEKLKEISYYISCISKNVNMIAKRVNSTDTVYAEDIKAIRNQIEEIKQMLREALKELIYNKKEM